VTRPAMAVRAAAVEWRRSCHDRSVLAGLGLTLLPVVSLLGSLPDDPRNIPVELLASLADPLGVALLADVAMIAAACTSVRTAMAFHDGIVGRDTLALGHGLPMLMRAVNSVLVGALLGAVAWGVAALAVRLVAGVGVVDLQLLGPVIVVGSWAGAWGFAIGSLVRAPLVVLLVTLLTLAPALLLASMAQDAVAATPLGSLLDAVGFPIEDGRGKPGVASVITVAWLGTLLAVAILSDRLRPRLA
jgi:hypothetical protein